jgi:hypothetical protein
MRWFSPMKRIIADIGDGSEAATANAQPPAPRGLPRPLLTKPSASLRNLARRLDQEAPGVAANILEGLDEMLTVNRLGLPAKLRRSLACTDSIENVMGTVRRVCRNVKQAKCRDGTALDRCRLVGGGQRLPSIESLQAPASSQSCACSSLIQVHRPTS